MNMRCVAACAAVLGLSGASVAQVGGIIAVGDEWLVSDQAFTQFQSQTEQLVDNIAGYFDNDGPSSFAVFSNNTIAYGTTIGARMTSLGHSWNVNPAQPFTLATLQQYDAVFLAGPVGSGGANAGTLAQYVNSGGRVMVMAGTGQFGSAPAEAAAWDPFLNTFGLDFGDTWFGRPPAGLLQIPAQPTSHPLGTLISTVLWGYGHTAMDLDPNNPANQVALYGDFTGQPEPPSGDVSNVPIIATYNIPAPGAGVLMFTAAGLAMGRRRR